MDCFNDFCIACDKESHNGGAYCSQTCRLADLERATAANATSPASIAPRTNSSSGYAHQSSPAYTFSPPRSAGAETRPTSSYFSSCSFYNHADPVPRSLTPSSSRSSLSSTISTSSTGARDIVSERARAELQSYYSSFDKVKQSKRRSGV